MLQKEISPQLKERAIAWIESVKEEIRRLNVKRVLKSQYGVSSTGFESVCVTQLKAGDTIKLRLSNKSSNSKSRLWIIDKIIPMGISAQLFLRCPTTDYEANCLLNLGMRVLRGN